MNGSCHTFHDLTYSSLSFISSTQYTLGMSRIWMSQIALINESWYTCAWVMSHLSASRDMLERVMSHITTSHGTGVNESCHAHDCVTTSQHTGSATFMLLPHVPFFEFSFTATNCNNTITTMQQRCKTTTTPLQHTGSASSMQLSHVPFIESPFTATHCNNTATTLQQHCNNIATNRVSELSASTTRTLFRIWIAYQGYGCCSVLQCVAVRCSVLQCVAVCCSMLQCLAVSCSVLQYCSMLQYVTQCCSVLQCVAVCCSVLQCVDVKESRHTCEWGMSVTHMNESRHTYDWVTSHFWIRLLTI